MNEIQKPANLFPVLGEKMTKHDSK